MIIRWQDNLSAIKRNQNFLFRRQQFLNNYYSALVVVPDLTFGVLSFIDRHGQGVEATISEGGQGVLGVISQSIGVLSIISRSGQGLEAVISKSGKGVEDKL